MLAGIVQLLQIVAPCLCLLSEQGITGIHLVDHFLRSKTCSNDLLLGTQTQHGLVNQNDLLNLECTGIVQTDGNIFRTFLLVPYVVPAIVIALVTRWMLSGDYGIISAWLQSAGWLDHRQSLLALPGPALCVVIIINIWRSYPFPMLIYWAALKGIDSAMYEAAKVDGATAWQIFWRITIPQLKDTTIILLVLRTVWTATYYDLIQMITGGGPAGSTTHLPIMIYQNSFGNPNIAYASAISVFLGALMFVFVVIYVKRSDFAED